MSDLTLTGVQLDGLLRTPNRTKAKRYVGDVIELFKLSKDYLYWGRRCRGALGAAAANTFRTLRIIQTSSSVSSNSAAICG